MTDDIAAIAERHREASGLCVNCWVPAIGPMTQATNQIYITPAPWPCDTERVLNALVEAREQLELADEYIEGMPQGERARLRHLIARLPEARK